MPRLADALRAFAPPVLVACAALSGLTTFRDLRGAIPPGEPPGARETAKHLTAVRRAVQPAARIVAVTPQVPALDFDFWFGLTHPVKILVPFPEGSTILPGAPLTAGEIRAELERRGALFTKEAFNAALAGADYVVFDGEAAAREGAAWSVKLLTHVLTSGHVSLHRAAGP